MPSAIKPTKHLSAIKRASMKKQTAVEWYYQQTIVEGKTNYAELLEQALTMEKEQIIEAYNNGENRSAELYYDETYNTDTL
jgi:hypothetical protein